MNDFALIRETLEWYADEIRYARVHRAADRHGEYAASDVMFDQGLRAQQALNHLLTTSVDDRLLRYETALRDIAGNKALGGGIEFDRAAAWEMLKVAKRALEEK